MTRPFRPSNGTGGDIFMAGFCNRCIHMLDDGRPPCDILGRSLGYSIGDPEYPAEWIEDDDGSNASCTAFQLPQDQNQPPVTPRCTETKDLFG